MRRIRLDTLLCLIAVVAAVMALTVYHQRATRREAQLLAALSLYRDLAQEAMSEALEQPIALSYPKGATLEDALHLIVARTRGPGLPKGTPIYIDPVGLQEAELSMSSPLKMVPSTAPLPLGVHLQRILGPLGLGYSVRSGLLTITSVESVDDSAEGDIYRRYRDVLK